MKRIPCATYRLQFNHGFVLRQASEILEYLSELGISDIYASPLLEAGAQSTHGYDTCSFEKLNPNLGSPEDFDRFANDLKNRGMGLLLDVVPNHMSASLANSWWMDVLREGRESLYADFFDIDWSPLNPALQGKVLLPVLEDHYGKVLESGKLQLVFKNEKYFIAYHNRNFPVNPASVPAGNPDVLLKGLNGVPGEARSFDKLDALIQRQHYRLSYWRAASEEINYRRFFDVTEMVALKMESPEVFKESHRLILEWVKAGKVTGLRVDHPDGLWEPKEYLSRLQASIEKDDATQRPLYVVVEKILSGNERLPADWPADGTTGYDFLNRVNGLFVDGFNALAIHEIYLKFIGHTESFADIMFDCRKQVLERSFASGLNALAHRLWKIAAGTRSGRDFTLSELRAVIVRIAANFPVYRTYITETSIGVSEQDHAVIQKAARDARNHSDSESDAATIDFIERILLLESSSELPGASQDAREFVMKFQQLSGPAMAKGLEDTAFYRFNQLISLNEVGGDPGKFGVTVKEFHEANAATAKNWPHTMLASATHDTKRGEDVRARLNVLSEIPVGWHNALGSWSRMNRDKKTVVAGAPAPDANDEYLLYQTLIGAWPADAADPGGRKSFRERITAFMLKAVKEAKVHTSWTEPNAPYEKALQDFIERILDADSHKAFIDDMGRFAGTAAFFGRFNSLSQTLLKIASPGLPDFYQGCELWDLNLVDPDNRRSVDFRVRQNLLADVKKSAEMAPEALREFLSGLLSDKKPGMMKLFLIWRTLNYRRPLRELFDDGDYIPLAAEGEKQKHVCAFARQTKDHQVIVMTPRLVLSLTQGKESPPIGAELWRDTVVSLPSASVGDVYRNVLTQETVAVTESNGKPALALGEILKTFPVALLEKA